LPTAVLKNGPHALELVSHLSGLLLAAVTQDDKMRAANLQPVFRLVPRRGYQRGEYREQPKDTLGHVARQYRYTKNQTRQITEESFDKAQMFYEIRRAVVQSRKRQNRIRTDLSERKRQTRKASEAPSPATIS
jgi:hypothetical protein